METIRTKRGLVIHFNKKPESVRTHFEHIPKLTEEFPLEVVLAYVFMKLELAQHLAIYCGIVKLHKTNSDLTWDIVNRHHMTRGGFKDKYETVFGCQIPKGIASSLETAEDVRDRVVHGKQVSESDIRNAVGRVLDYADGFSSHVKAKAGFDPCGSLRGFKGRAAGLDKSTTRWILRGMGFDVG